MPRGKIREWIGKIASFMASNMIGTVVDTTVLWVFSTYVFDHYVRKFAITEHSKEITGEMIYFPT